MPGNPLLTDFTVTRYSSHLLVEPETAAGIEELNLGI
jgi:hypothetical protein